MPSCCLFEFSYNSHKEKISLGSARNAYFKISGKIKIYRDSQFCLHKFIANAKILIKLCEEYFVQFCGVKFQFKLKFNFICIFGWSENCSQSIFLAQFSQTIFSILLTQIHCKCKDFNEIVGKNIFYNSVANLMHIL